MKASLTVEAIGHNSLQYMKLYTGIMRECGMNDIGTAMIGGADQWARWGVWEITPDGVKRVEGRTDYSQANSKGSRGVMVWYTLESGKRYIVRSPTSWKNTEEYCCHVNDAGEVIHE